MSPLSVWLFPSAYAPHIGGIERSVADLAAGLRASGHRATVITNRYPSNLAVSETVDGIEVFRYEWPSPSRSLTVIPKFFTRMARTLKGLSKLPAVPPDVIHVHGLSSHNPYVLATARYYRAPLLLTTHGELNASLYQPGRAGSWSRFWSRKVITEADLVLAPAFGVIDDAAKVGVTLPATSRVLANGIDLTGWRDIPDPPASSRVVGAWGRLSREKGFDRLIDAWPAVRATVPDAELWVAGDGPEYDNLHARLGHGTRLTGPLTKEQLCRLLAATTTVVVPSRHEAFGLVGLEALAAGRTVIYASGTGLDESVGDQGIPVNCADPAAFSRAIVNALQQPALTARPAVRTTGQMIEETIDVYTTLLRKSQPIGCKSITDPRST